MKTSSKFLSALLTLAIMLGTLTLPAMAVLDIEVILNGTKLSFDVPPRIMSGRTMVPMREIFEALGAEIDWDGDKQTITAQRDGIVIIMQIDNLTMKIGAKDVLMDIPPQIVDNRTLISVRAVAEGLNAEVDWDDRTQTVVITTKNNFTEEIPRFESIEPYITGSNQEWALSAISKLNNSAEKIRLYNYLLRAHTYLMIYDTNDYTDQYYGVKNTWLNAMPDFNEESRADLRLMLDDENWIIDIWYPLEKQFTLSMEEFLQVYFYFTDANPQFFLNMIVPVCMNSDMGLSLGISIPAYYAPTSHRQKTYNNIQNAFDNFKLKLVNSIDVGNQYNVVKYVYDHVVETLSYDYEYAPYRSRERIENQSTILGYFGDSKLTICKGYATIMMYLLNRLGIPTIDQGGTMIIRDNNGDIINLMLHAWNIVKINNKWYFLDATWDAAGEYNWFLKGRGENNDSHFLNMHSIAEDMIYPEVNKSDF